MRAQTARQRPLATSEHGPERDPREGKKRGALSLALGSSPLTGLKGRSRPALDVAQGNRVVQFIGEIAEPRKGALSVDSPLDPARVSSKRK